MNKKDFCGMVMRNVKIYARRKYELKEGDKDIADNRLAKDAKISPQILRNWAAAANWPSTGPLTKLAAYLNCQPWQLVHPNPRKLERDLSYIRQIQGGSDEKDDGE